MENALMGPVLAQVGLTFVMWFVLYARRLPAMKAAKPTPDQLRDKGNLSKLPLPARYAGENYNHLFEMPVLFYVLTLGAMIGDLGDASLVDFAWTYVALRVIHSAIHISYNNVMHRFTVFTVSGVVLLVMYAKLAMQFWGF